jgi:hypothetical protein
VPRSRLVQTSQGPLAVELDEAGFGFQVEVTLFRADGSEARPTRKWSRKLREESLAQFLVNEAGLPGPEATELATEIQGPWREDWMGSGGEEDVRSLRRFMRVAFPTLVLVLLLGLVGLGLLVWLFFAEVA